MDCFLSIHLYDPLDVQKQQLVLAHGEKSEGNTKYDLNPITQKTVHYPDNSISTYKKKNR